MVAFQLSVTRSLLLNATPCCDRTQNAKPFWSLEFSELHKAESQVALSICLLRAGTLWRVALGQGRHPAGQSHAAGCLSLAHAALVRQWFGCAATATNKLFSSSCFSYFTLVLTFLTETNGCSFDSSFRIIQNQSKICLTSELKSCCYFAAVIHCFITHSPVKTCSTQ